jgi:hypothetical protein
MAPHQKHEQLHGQLFQAQNAVTPFQPVARFVEGEVAEMEFLGRKRPRATLGAASGMMPRVPRTVNRISELELHLIFTSGSEALHCQRKPSAR